MCFGFSFFLTSLLYTRLTARFRGLAEACCPNFDPASPGADSRMTALSSHTDNLYIQARTFRHADLTCIYSAMSCSEDHGRTQTWQPRSGTTRSNSRPLLIRVFPPEELTYDYDQNLSWLNFRIIILIYKVFHQPLYFVSAFVLYLYIFLILNSIDSQN